MPRDTSFMTFMNATTATTTPLADDCIPPEDALVMGLLSQHVPIALLCDLSTPDGPQSAQILAEEGRPDTAWWER